jgi:hypothetical protein
MADVVYRIGRFKRFLKRTLLSGLSFIKERSIDCFRKGIHFETGQKSFVNIYQIFCQRDTHKNHACLRWVESKMSFSTSKEIRKFAKMRQFWRKFVKFCFWDRFQGNRPGVSGYPGNFATISKTPVFAQTKNPTHILQNLLRKNLPEIKCPENNFSH